MVYGDLDAREVLVEVIGDVEEAKAWLRQAEAKMTESNLSEKPGYREVAEFIGAALRNAHVASDAATRRLKST
jgi:hypothetical protein